MRNLIRTISFTLAVATGAFLVFQVQPIVSKRILPWFGGSPAVWTTCMLFFQVVLFGGYLYAHALTRLFTPRRQGLVHTLLVCVALLALPIIPDASWKPLAGEQPSLRILLLLVASVGVPYFVLSATGPLMQVWFSHVTLGRSPYRFFALSNLGSLVALLSYPVLFEPVFTVAWQGVLWTLLFSLYALACAACVWQLWNQRTHPCHPSAEKPADEANAARPAPGRLALWLVLPALASVMLLATTNHVCQNLPPTPFLWVVPLSLYLLTFIISFDSQRWYVRTPFASIAMASCFVLSLRTTEWFAQQYLLEVVVCFVAMFCVCMLCHGELVRLKPAPRHLTLFYLMCSAGGALGGLIVAIACPWLLDSYFEMNVCNVAGFGLAAVVLASETGLLNRMSNTGTPTADLRTVFPLRAGCGCLLGLAVLMIVNSEFIKPAHSSTDAATRNFYGVVSIKSDSSDQPGERLIAMVHGQIIHGVQFDSPQRRREPTTYYHRQSGVGRTLHAVNRQREEPLHVGNVGMGAGTIAVYGRPLDRYRFYEINPAVIDFADRHFSFVSDSAAMVTTVPGDARLSLENEPPQQFDVLVLDAFSGDAVPAHLLTTQAMAVYLRHLKGDGVIAVHVSNDYLDLRPVIVGLAAEYELSCVYIDTPGDRKRWKFRSKWMLLTRDETLLQSPEISDVARLAGEADVSPVVWTDDFNNLLHVLKSAW